MTTNIPVYEAKITGMDNTGIFALSFVDWPANEHNFVALRKKRPTKLNLNRQKQILTGVVLVPDQLIYRFDETDGEYYLKFTAPDIEKIAQKMMKTGIALSTTTHQHARPLRGNHLTEIWIVADSKRDKSVALGLGELPVGTLVASYKINDANYWHNEVLTGKVKGFSIEGLFNFNSINMKKQTTKNPKAPAKNKSGNSFAAFLKSMAVLMEGDTAAAADDLADEADKDEVDAGDPVLIFELADGGEVRVDSEGFATLDGAQMAAGEHVLADGNFIVINDDGVLEITTDEPEDTDAEEAPTELEEQARKRGATFLKIMDKDPAKAAAMLKAAGSKEKAKPTAKDAKIAALKKQLAALEKEPSTEKVKATAAEKVIKDQKDMTFTEKMAAVIASRRARSTKKQAAPDAPAKKK